MSTKFRFSGILLVAALLALSTVVAACGDDDTKRTGEEGEGEGEGAEGEGEGAEGEGAEGEGAEGEGEGAEGEGEGAEGEGEGAEGEGEGAEGEGEGSEPTVAPGGACTCDSECLAPEGYDPVCVIGICMIYASAECSGAGSQEECPEGSRCWGLTEDVSMCWPDCNEDGSNCDGECDADGSCVFTDETDCDPECASFCRGGGGGDFSCGEVLDCMLSGDMESSDCYYAGTPEAQATFDEMYDCWDEYCYETETEEEWTNCIIESCVDLNNACVEVECGDDACHPLFETRASCADDCVYCGNNYCEEDADETIENCPDDCLSCGGVVDCMTSCDPWFGDPNCPDICYARGTSDSQEQFDAMLACWDEKCPWEGRAFDNCIKTQCGDATNLCLAAECGDDVCTPYAENRANCLEDCAVCGDGICDEGEDLESCELDCAEPPDNALCADAEVITASGTQELSGTTVGARTEYNGNRGPDVWYSFTLEAPTTVALTVSGDDEWDSYLYLLKGDCEANTLVAENDDSSLEDTLFSAMEAKGLNPGQYLVVVTGYSGAKFGPFDLTAKFTAFVPSCGDDICSTGTEDATSCEADCLVCGDKVCTEGKETLASCPKDCAVCGDEVCTNNVETVATCGADCDGTCGDAICSADNEDVESCAVDCQPPANDTCANAAVLELGVLTEGTTRLAAIDYDPQAGPDVFYRFTLAEAGIVELTLKATTEPQWDTFLFLIQGESCDRNTMFANEIANNDDFPGVGSSWIQYRALPAGTYTVVVSGYSASSFGAFTLKAMVIGENAPTITEGVAYTAGDSLIVRFAGVDVDENVQTAKIVVVDDDGLILPVADEDENLVNVELVVGAEGAYVAYAVLPWSEDLAEAKTAIITAIDSIDLESEAFEAAIAPQPEKAEGEVCDPRKWDDHCVAHSACFKQEDGTFECVHVNAPTISLAKAYLLDDAVSIGVLIQGADIEKDATALHIVIVDVEGDPLMIETEDGTEVPLQGTFELEGSIVWAEDANTFEIRMPVSLPEVFEDAAGAQLELIDATGEVSEAIIANFEAPPELESGAVCDQMGVFGTCPAGTFCIGEDVTVCAVAKVECPADYDVIELEFADNHTITYDGDTTDSELYLGGSCGGGAGANVHHLVLPIAGTVTITTIDTADEEADTVLYVRTHCGVGQSELACNDDAEGLGAYTSLAILEDMQAGDELFVFVDGYAGWFSAWTGEYTLKIGVTAAE